MNIVPKLTPSKFFFKTPNGMYQHDCEAFGETGLNICLFRIEHTDVVTIKVQPGAILQYDFTDDWRINHSLSGKAILRRIKNRETAIHYLMKLWNVQHNWNLSEEQITGTTSLGDCVKAMQDQIDSQQKGRA